MMVNWRISPKGCNDYRPKNKNGQKSRRDGIVVSPPSGFEFVGRINFYNLTIPSVFKMEMI